VRFRASYNRAVRAPNVVELFQPQVIGLAGSADPCAGPTPAATLDQCMLTGVTAAQYGNIVDSPGGQYNVFSGGNPNLKPESANTYTAGVALQPRFIPGLAATFDYFNIKLKGAIGTIGFDTIMNQCITTGDPMFCSRIKRMQGNGSLWFFVTDINKGGYIVDINTNLGSLQTRGVDVQASYARRIGGVGNLNLSLVGTYVRNERINPIAESHSIAPASMGRNAARRPRAGATNSVPDLPSRTAWGSPGSGAISRPSATTC
jgi:outer membrane receptor protein involved in Fe transport